MSGSRGAHGACPAQEPQDAQALADQQAPQE
jgi:hypothetical protein